MGLFQGRVYTWGYLGLGDGNGGTNSSGVWPTARVEIPRSVFGNNDVVQILIGGNADGGYCMYALTDAGTVYSMGGGHGVTMSPSLGTGITTGATQATFTLMSGLTGVVQITANRSNSYNNFYALKSDGTVWGCGYNQYGEIDRSADVWVSTCRQVPGVSNVVKVLAWGYGTVSGMMALTSTGSVIMRGRNDSGAYLGNAEDAHSNGVGVPDDGNVIAIESGAVDIQAYGNIYVGSSGYTTFVVLMSDGSIYHWGLSQGYAQIDASNVNIEVPTRRIVT
jgi:alpha-tubulin suppressor-like RCC1 family protein